MNDFDQQEAELQDRRKRYAQQLAGAVAPQGRMVGNTYVAANPLEYLAAGLRGYGGMRGEQMAGDELKELQGKKQAAMQSDMSAMLGALRGKPAETVQPLTPNDDEGNVNPPIQMPAKAGSMDEFYRVAASSQFPQFQQMGMQGAITSAQQQAEKIKADQERKGYIETLQRLGPAEAVRQGLVPSNVATEFANARNLGRDEVSGQLEIEGPNGEKLIQKIDKYGQPVGAPTPAYTAPVQVNTGGSIQFVKPKAGTSLQVGMSPSERDASARGWATVRQGSERIEIDKNKSGGATKPLTESQAKGSLYLGQMRTANNELDALEAQGKTASPTAVAAAGSTWTNWATSDDAQRVAQLENQWSEGFLRAKTGAAATGDEVALNRRTFFPVVGDSAAVIKQKAQMRRQAEKDMEIVAGAGADRAGGSEVQPVIRQPANLPTSGRVKFDMNGNAIYD